MLNSIYNGNIRTCATASLWPYSHLYEEALDSLHVLGCGLMDPLICNGISSFI